VSPSSLRWGIRTLLVLHMRIPNPPISGLSAPVCAGGYDYKKTIVDTYLSIIEKIPTAQTDGQFPHHTLSTQPHGSPHSHA